MQSKIRAYEERDQANILEIAKQTWEGHDHLPLILAEWETDPQSHLFVHDINGEAVSIGNLRVIENGKTGWMEGLRIHPDYRGKGFAKSMTEYLIKTAKGMGLERVRLTTAMENNPAFHLAHIAGFRLLYDRKVFWAAAADRLKFPEETLTTKPASNEEVLQLVPYLVPYGALIHFWYALDATNEAIDEIRRKGEFWIGRKGNEPVALSLGFENESSSGREWCVTIYAQDPVDILSTLAFHIKVMKEKGLSAIMCLHSPSFEPAHHGVSSSEGIVHTITLGLLEKNLR